MLLYFPNFVVKVNLLRQNGQRNMVADLGMNA